MQANLKDVVARIRHDAEMAENGVPPADLPALLESYADCIEKACDWQYQFTLELCYADAAGCLDDARLVAVEREYHGIAHLVDHARACLERIGCLTGINGRKLIEGRN